MKLKEIDRTAHVAWSPAKNEEQTTNTNYLIAGTAAQQLDASFSTNSQLEVFQVNLADRSMSMAPIGSIKTDYRFNKLIWPSLKLLIGATEKGRIYLVDPLAQSITQQLDKHTGSVHSIDMNTLQPNLFASGGSNSELMIWDLNDLKQPMIPGGTSPSSHHIDEEVQCVSWNRQKSHILGSTLGGKTLIWDLKSSNEPIFKITDSTYRMRANRLVWHPDITSQLCLASEEDQSASIQLWDLRFGTSPVKLLTGHTRGILDLQWSPNDGNLLMSSGKDNKIICWNPNDLQIIPEIVYEIPCNHWCFDVKWCLVDPNLISASSFDGTLSIYTLMGGSCQVSRPVNNQLFTQAFGDGLPPTSEPHPSTTTHDVLPIKYAPKWMRRQTRVSFGFGGKLVIVQHPPTPTATSAESGPASPNATSARRLPVLIQQVVVDHAFVQTVQTFDTMLQAGTLLDYCDHQISSTVISQDEQILWRFLRASFESDPRNKYIELLGFRRDDILHKVQTLTSNEKHNLPTESLNGLHLDDNHTKKHSNAEIETLLSRCIMLGQFEAAVELCCNEQRYTDALLLAHLGGQDLLYKTQKRYFEKVQTPTTKLIDIVTNQDWPRLIESSNMTNWRDILVALLTYTNGATFIDLCNQLGHRLAQQHIGTNDSLRTYAAICFICTGNLEQFDIAWSSKYQQQGMSSMQLEQLIEKLFILKRSVDYSSAQQKKTVNTAAASMDGPSISRHLTLFGQLLANEGCARAALVYLGNIQTPELLVLRDRLYYGLPANQLTGIPKPSSPFRRVDVPTPQQQQNQQQMQQRKPSSNTTQHFRPTLPTEPVFTPPSNNTWAPLPPQNSINDNNMRPGLNSMTNRPPPQPTNPSYPPNFYNPATAVPSHFTPAPTPTPMMSNQQFVHGYPNSAPSPAVNNAPNAPPLGPSALSYQDSKPASAWNDPPTVMMKVSKHNPVKPPGSSTDGFATTNSPFLPVVNEPPPPQSTFHFNPTITNQPTGPVYPPSTPSDFIHHSAPSVQEPTVRKVATPPPPPAPVVKGPLPTEHQIIQDTLDLLANRCQQATQQLPLKRKLDEVKKKLEVLYDKLRENRVPQSVLQGIHQIIGYIRQYDYQSSLLIYNQLIASENLAETSQYMPAVKILLQCCMQLNVYCQ
ncbi:unnamed protein product [Adineta steineri]|uniref:Protein transport protein Sec31A n=1 Tax=Adineta steineri TaxID=433720 RepID=A0A813MA46_9BILA|nr:unnamed protein product [Adineta steineri]CAF3613140.1 unnamed protein product [Adineta steineri]